MITVLGVFNADLKFSVDRFPKPGETLHGNGFETQPGGKGFNQAIAAKRAGAGKVAMLTALGADNFGEMARSVMAEDGVDASAILTIDDAPTGTAMIMVEGASAQNMIVIAPGAANRLEAEMICGFEDQIANSHLFMTNFEVPMEAVLAGLKLAKKHGVPTLLDPAPATQLPPEIYGLVDFITPNESEAAALLGEEVSDLDDAIFAARELCESGLGTAVITMGALGAVAGNFAGHVVQETLDVGEVRDTVGAGDAFNGAFAAALVNGMEIPDAMRHGAAGAAYCVTRNGAAQAMATVQEIGTLLDKHPTRGEEDA